MENEVLYGQETQKALENFGKGKIPRDFIQAYGEVKKAALESIQECTKKFPEDVFLCIVDACNMVIRGEMDNQFPLSLRQGGAGTSINMNFNEVIAHLASKLYTIRHGNPVHLSPIEDINLYQSTNDTFPTALTIMAYRHLCDIEQEVIRLQEVLIQKENEYGEVLMIGRTEMQNALPITLGQVFGAWAGAIARDRWRINKLKERIRTIALGGTALGTCFFAPREYIFFAEKKLREITKLPLTRSQNLPDEISNQDKIAELASGYSLVAQNLFKISGDLLLYTSSMIGEIAHPSLQYGSSIMAAKTNPVVLEYVRGISIFVQGEAYKIQLYSQNGQLQLNAFLPFVVESLHEIHQSFKHSIPCFVGNFFQKMEVQYQNIEKNLASSLALLNCLIPKLGYNKIKSLYEGLNPKTPFSLEETKNFILENTELTKEDLEQYFLPFLLTNAMANKKK
ncbi:MAG: fumarate lyase [Candidatus Brocadiae bacterium]|nr:fumarate lyase [Candidatus Brocadiia bacterium]